MRTQQPLLAAALTVLLVAVLQTETVRGKFVKIENLHSKEANEGGKNKNNWSPDSLATSSSSSASSPSSVASALSPNRTTLLRGYRTVKGGGGGGKLLQSVNEVRVDEDSFSDGSSKKEWKSFFYPHHHHHNYPVAGTTAGTVYPGTFGSSWSNGVINNNNLLTVGGYSPVTATTIGGAYDFGLKPAAAPAAAAAAPAGLQCLLFGVMGLVTFLLNSVMALLLSVKLPALDGLLGPLLGGLGLGALMKQDVAAAADTKSKNMEYVRFPENGNSNGDGGGNHSGDDNLEYFEKNQ